MRAFAGEYILWVVCSIPAAIYLTIPMAAIFGDYFDIESENPVGVMYFLYSVFISSFAFIVYSINRRKSYKLSIKNGVIEFAGRSRWFWVNKTVPAKFVTRINVGGITSTMEKIASMQSRNRSFFEKRLVFHFTDSKPIALNNAAKIFDKDSLNEFFNIAVKSGIEVNACV